VFNGLASINFADPTAIRRDDGPCFSCECPFARSPGRFFDRCGWQGLPALGADHGRAMTTLGTFLMGIDGKTFKKVNQRGAVRASAPCSWKLAKKNGQAWFRSFSVRSSSFLAGSALQGRSSGSQNTPANLPNDGIPRRPPFSNGPDGGYPGALLQTGLRRPRDIALYLPSARIRP